jgi:hypothetical protein
VSGADAVLPDGERSEPDEDGQGRASVTRAAWRLLGAALISQIGISVVEQGIPVLTGFIKTDHRCVCRGGGADRLRVHGRTGTRLVRSRCRRRPALAGVALIGFQGLWVTMIS